MIKLIEEAKVDRALVDGWKGAQEAVLKNLINQINKKIDQITVKTLRKHGVEISDNPSSIEIAMLTDRIKVVQQINSEEKILYLDDKPILLFTKQKIENYKVTIEYEELGVIGFTKERGAEIENQIMLSQINS